MAPELQKKMDEVFKWKSLLSLDLLQVLTDMNYKEFGVKIVITRDKDIASQVKDSIKSRFTQKPL